MLPSGVLRQKLPVATEAVSQTAEFYIKHFFFLSHSQEKIRVNAEELKQQSRDMFYNKKNNS